ncbi:hypothetical protein [uncultured Serinicoccus sp.]|uniref:hypothetical protein n=1 Tax=uncultured Serinicoccus sp. TaxID=735514 RepID=UPI00262B87A2|nr:hypothetical protein [uncultured Serinicoccus sp.]
MGSWVDGGATERVLSDFGVAWDEVSTGTPASRVLMLRGGTGSGRTGLLQACYEVAVARRNAGQYWPADIDAGADPVAGRDTVFPDPGQCAPGNRLPWMWWGLTGQLGTVEAGKGQLDAHASELRQALKDLDEITRKRLKLLGRTSVLLAGLVPGVGTAVQVVEVGAGAVDLATNADLFRGPGTVLTEALANQPAARTTARPDTVTPAQEEGRFLAVLSSLLPLVVAVDQAEDLDRETLELLNALVRSRGSRVLVVLAVNTDFHPTHPEQ